MNKLERPDTHDTLNPGDKVSPEEQTLEQKSEKVAVDAPDITGDHIEVPTYFNVKDENGEEKALHHVEDAEEISDVIRQARTDEQGNRNLALELDLGVLRHDLGQSHAIVHYPTLQVVANFTLLQERSHVML
ncbi:hypothetical protein MC7420_6899 [Coleofasciculus chthonoplastes PCC 7420]|uniref:Uncharacterized protein n=1 Tax=Coleofasciculus chthonoplastes PCC 7420 TaxID=118168 RepID=B4W1S2_9CYAN|nr:hypothetical protein MC7420_6899 [Coleofasciculus chthonoplastes PCC 7420]